MQTTAPPSPKQQKSAENRQNKGTLFQLQVVIGVAFVLATLFTAWTPGQFSIQDEQAIAPALQTPIPIASPVAQGTVSSTERTNWPVGIVAGHWGHDSGAVCNDGLQEVEVNLKIASLVQKYLHELGYEVDLLKEFDMRLAGYQAAALVSIHADSCDYINDQATGFKVASALGSVHPERAARLTACLRSRYGQATALPLHSTSVTIDMTSYHAFGEISENTPAAIIETGFMNLDRQLLTQNPELIAQAITDGITCYLRNESITPTTPIATP